MERINAYVGLDVHKETIAVAVANEGSSTEITQAAPRRLTEGHKSFWGPPHTDGGQPCAIKDPGGAPLTPNTIGAQQPQ